MRKFVFILFGLIIILLLVGFVYYGLKKTEMPVKEVHKVISVSKLHAEMKIPSIPATPDVPASAISSSNNQINAPATGNALSSSLPQPGTVPGNAAGSSPVQH